MTRTFVPTRGFLLGLILLTGCLALTPLALAEAAGGLNQGVQPIALADLFPGATFDPAIPTQEAVTGVKPGQRPLRPEEVLAFYRALAAASPRASLLEYSRSYEARPLVVLAVSDEATVADLDGFRKSHVELLDSRNAKPAAAADLTGAKAVAWMAYGIHGDELSSTDAAASLAYLLVAGTDEATVGLRKKLLILIDPCENPDGRARYLAQTLSFAHRKANPDQDDLSHRTVWPWGRGSHYLFDLNRDWFVMTQPESRRTVVIADWLPQVMVDSHEMGANSTYLFPPPRHPFNPDLPANTRKWAGPFSEDQAQALDERGYPYFTGEWNEEFFPGYGSSWASYHGTIGILYEMSRTSGTLVRKRSGTVRTFAQAIEHQTTSSLANLNSLAQNAPQILADQIAARADAVKTGNSAMVRAWVFPVDPRHPGRLDAFAALLMDQGIETMTLTGPSAKGKNLVSARTGEDTTLELPAGTLLVKMDQPSGNLARVLLDPHIPMNAEFFIEEREYIEKGKGSRLYDTTAWSLPLLRGLPAYWSGSVPSGQWVAWREPVPAAANHLEGPFGSVVIDGDPDNVPALLTDLLQAGVTVRVARKPFTIGGRTFHRGALVIRSEGNLENLDDILKQMEEKHSVTMVVVKTARAEDGPDLGGDEYPILVAPRVGVLTGMPVAPTGYGAIWHLLDQDLDLRFNALDVGRFASTDLSRYNVLVFPGIYGGPGMYRQVLGPGGVDRLRRWIEGGGTAIGCGGGARMLADQETELTRTRFRSQALEEFPPPVWSISAVEAEAAGMPVATGMRVTETTGEKTVPKADPKRMSPYDVAPVFGPGALPFTEGSTPGAKLADPPVSLSTWLKPVLPAGQASPSEAVLKAADQRLRRFMPQGAILRADLDEDFWLNFGLGSSISVWFGSDDSMIAAPPVTVAARFPDTSRIHLAGLLWPEAAARLADTGYATRETLGRGQIILFADNPEYRRWVVETERMFINAILLGPGLGTRWSSPW